MASIKGVKIERAAPSNIIEVFRFYKQYYEEFGEAKSGKMKITKADMTDFYFKLLYEFLPDPSHVIYLARRGKAYWGIIHAQIVSKPMLGSPMALFIHTVFIRKGKRKLGVGSKLADKIEEDAVNLNAKTIEFMCRDNLVEKWEKHGAKKFLNYMIKEL